VVRFLVEKGADIIMANNGGWTPVNSDADSGHLEVFKVLAENSRRMKPGTPIWPPGEKQLWQGSARRSQENPP
jgi:ankyrin repeat protein